MGLSSSVVGVSFAYDFKGCTSFLHLLSKADLRGPGDTTVDAKEFEVHQVRERSALLYFYFVSFQVDDG